MAAKPVRAILRLLLTGIQQVRRSIWFLTQPETYGAHAVPITPAGKIVLVKLRYAPGWRLPGGGRKENEDPGEAVIRELREEIGLLCYGSVEAVAELRERPDFKRDTASLFIVREVQYSPSWSLEVEAVREAAINNLPSDTSARTLNWIAAVRPFI